MDEYVRATRRKHRRAKRRARRAFAIFMLCNVAAAVFLAVTLVGRLMPERQRTPAEDSGAVKGSGADESVSYEPQPPGDVEGDMMSQLTSLLAEYPALAPVVETPERYPESLMRLFLVNRELLDTLLLYPEHGGDAAGAVTNADAAGGFPALMQWDPRWAYRTYGDDMMAVTGCGPTCLSAVAIHLTGNLELTPATVAAWAEADGYYAPGTGSTWQLMSEGAARLGLASEELPLGESQISAALRAGRPVICSMRQGDFTTGGGHFIVLTSIDEAGNISVHDPARNSNNARTWRYDEIAHQIKNLWAFSRA